MKVLQCKIKLILTLALGLVLMVGIFSVSGVMVRGGVGGVLSSSGKLSAVSGDIGSYYDVGGRKVKANEGICKIDKSSSALKISGDIDRCRRYIEDGLSHTLAMYYKVNSELKSKGNKLAIRREYHLDKSPFVEALRLAVGKLGELITGLDSGDIKLSNKGVKTIERMLTKGNEIGDAINSVMLKDIILSGNRAKQLELADLIQKYYKASNEEIKAKESLVVMFGGFRTKHWTKDSWLRICSTLKKPQGHKDKQKLVDIIERYHTDTLTTDETAKKEVLIKKAKYTKEYLINILNRSFNDLERANESNGNYRKRADKIYANLKQRISDRFKLEVKQPKFENLELIVIPPNANINKVVNLIDAKANPNKKLSLANTLAQLAKLNKGKLPEYLLKSKKDTYIVASENAKINRAIIEHRKNPERAIGEFPTPLTNKNITNLYIPSKNGQYISQRGWDGNNRIMYEYKQNLSFPLILISRPNIFKIARKFDNKGKLISESRIMVGQDMAVLDKFISPVTKTARKGLEVVTNIKMSLYPLLASVATGLIGEFTGSNLLKEQSKVFWQQFKANSYVVNWLYDKENQAPENLRYTNYSQYLQGENTINTTMHWITALNSLLIKGRNSLHKIAGKTNGTTSTAVALYKDRNTQNAITRYTTQIKDKQPLYILNPNVLQSMGEIDESKAVLPFKSYLPVVVGNEKPVSYPFKNPELANITPQDIEIIYQIDATGKPVPIVKVNKKDDDNRKPVTTPPYTKSSQPPVSSHPSLSLRGDDNPRNNLYPTNQQGNPINKTQPTILGGKPVFANHHHREEKRIGNTDPRQLTEKQLFNGTPSHTEKFQTGLKLSSNIKIDLEPKTQSIITVFK
jgi:hypothetical protein